MEIRRRQRKTETLLEYIPRITPRYGAPHHLAPLIERLERARIEPLRLVVSTPPRHGKTETLLHFIAQSLTKDPACQVAYIGYGTNFAQNKSRKTRDIAKRSGLEFARDQNSKANWRTGVADGGLWATGIDGEVTGEGFHLIVVDDPVKDRATAESPVYRDHHFDSFNDNIFTRLEPNGSCIVNMARWHPDDLAGRLIDQGWEYLCLPALDEHDEPLWGERYSKEHLAEIREQLGDYGWNSLFQGRPVSRGGAVFKDVHYYDGPVPTGARYVIGVDLAYSQKTRADYSVAVVMAELGGVVYLVDVVRVQLEAPAFGGRLAALQAKYGARAYWYASGTEKGVADLLGANGAPVEWKAAVSDKFVRAQPTAAHWNKGAIKLPRGASWADEYVSEVASFTGVKDKRDDQIDATAAGFDELITSAPSPIRRPAIVPPTNRFGSGRGF